jgi:hypothetical protein
MISIVLSRRIALMSLRTSMPTVFQARLSRSRVRVSWMSPALRSQSGGICAHGSQILVIRATVEARTSRGSVYAASMVARTV